MLILASRRPPPSISLSHTHTCTHTSTRTRTHTHTRTVAQEEGTGLLLDQGAAAVPERGPVGPLAAARRALALNNTTGGLPCRETEKTALRRFISGAVEEGEPRRERGVVSTSPS